MASPNTLKKQGKKFVLKDHGAFTAVNKKEKDKKPEILVNEARQRVKQICGQLGISLKRYRKISKKARQQQREKIIVKL